MRRGNNAPDMIFGTTRSLNTASSRSTVLINPITSGDTGIESGAIAALPAWFAWFVVVVGVETMFAVAGGSGDDRKEEGEEGEEEGCASEHCEIEIEV